MNTPLKLNISQPCHESWKAMTPSEQGRFCASCSKIVVDFSVMTDRQIQEYFSNYSGSTCGRFTNDQLNRTITPDVQRPKNWFKYALGFMLPALLVAGKSYSQGKPMPTAKTCSETSAKQKKQKAEKKVIKELPSNVEDITMGTPVKIVPDEDILIGVVVDGAGTDTAATPFLSLDTYLPVTEDSTDSAAVTFDNIMVGEVITTLGFTVPGVYIEEENVFTKFNRFIADTLTGQSLKLYPNPALPGSVININYKLTKGVYYIQVLDLNGRVLQQEVVNVAGQELTVPLRLYNHLVKGQYAILIANEKRKKIASKPFIML